MRIIGGIHKGKKLPISNKLDLRPTTDRARESLINLLRNKIDFEDIRFLDLFSGTGAVSYELISLGAGAGVCVDISQTSHRYRSAMIEELGRPDLKNIKADVFKFCRRSQQSFDLVFADPPYAHPDLAKLPDLIFECGLLKADGLFVLEHPEEHTFGKHSHFDSHRKYGRVNFSFFI